MEACLRGMGQMITQFPVNRAISLFTAFAAGALLTALLLSASEPDHQAKSYQARIRSLEAAIAARDKTLKKIARRERELSLLMESADLNGAALEIDAGILSQKTARAHKQLAESRFADSKNREKENEPLFKDSSDDSDLVIRFDRLLAGMGVGKGKAG